jgi:hypothetical protein
MTCNIRSFLTAPQVPEAHVLKFHFLCFSDWLISFIFFIPIHWFFSVPSLLLLNPFTEFLFQL